MSEYKFSPEELEQIAIATVKAIKEAKSEQEKKSLTELLVQLKDGSFDVASSGLTLTFRGGLWCIDKGTPLFSGGANFLRRGKAYVLSCLDDAKKKRAKNEDK